MDIINLNNMKTIKLPNNTFGLFLMLFILILIAIIPFVTTLWLISMIAPWWVAVPFSLFVSLGTFLKVTEFKK